MSPRSVRRYRADRLLHREFDATRASVLAAVRRRLGSAGVKLDNSDLEACYAQAWHGLYTTMLAGEVEIANPAGWLTLVTYRRALDEHRARTRACGSAGHQPDQDARVDEADHAHDPADGLEQRARLRQLVEGLRGRLGPRERQAATLCYLQGLSRADAAARMGISQARMRKLMDGPRPGSPGVAAKMSELLEAIRAGSFCAQQASLMRGLAFGILDPAGERYMLAQAHSRECPACRAYVLTLRGLAAFLPPLPLPLALGAGAAAGAASRAGAGATSSAGGGATAATGAGAVGGAGVGVTGGGWLLASGGLSAKLAAGCLLTMTVGFGCAVLTIGPTAPAHPIHHARARRTSGAGAGAGSLADFSTAAATAHTFTPTSVSSSGSRSSPGPDSGSRSGSGPGSGSAGAYASALTPAAQASREFGPEQQAGDGSGQAAEAGPYLQAAGSTSAPTASASRAGDAGSRKHARRPRTADRREAGAGANSSSGTPSSPAAVAAGAGSGSSSPSGTGESVAAGATSESGSGPAGESTGSGSTGESAAANPGPPSAAEREFGI